MSLETATMKTLSSRAPFSGLPDDVLQNIDDRLKNYNAKAYEKRVNDYVSRYGDATLHGADHLRKTLIDEINKEIRNYQNGLQTKRELDDAIDAIIGDRGFGGKKRTKRTKRTNRTKCTKRTKRTKRTYKRRK